MSKRILVVDVAAHEGGALSILRQYHRLALEDADNTYLFCLSLPELAETDRVKTRRFPWVKKGWLHRLWFDHITVRRVIKDFAPDEILSLQNITVSHTKLPQTLYLHQPLPFCGYTFTLRQNPKFWVYQRLIGRRILKSVRRADKVIVQTQWMKKAVCEKAGVSGDTLVIEPPASAVHPTGQFDKAKWDRLFFFPAAPYAYKNHKVILEAMSLLRQEGITDYRVQFTLTPDQLVLTKEQESLRPQLVLNGMMPAEEVMDTYTRSVLIFPSYIETFGLPLLEARMSGAPVLAAEAPFSREILQGYADAAYFDAFSPRELAVLIKQKLEEGV